MIVADEGDNTEQIEEEEEVAVGKKSKKQKENRPIKKAVRKLKEPQAESKRPEQSAKTDTPPRRVTRSSMKRVT